MSKHTKGPWSVEQALSDDYGSRTDVSHWVRSGPMHGVEELGGMVLASVVSDCISSSEANARLIAAAPDLLEALEQMMVCFWPSFNGQAWNAKQLEAARKAIARAKGEGK